MSGCSATCTKVCCCHWRKDFDVNPLVNTGSTPTQVLLFPSDTWIRPIHIVYSCTIVDAQCHGPQSHVQTTFTGIGIIWMCVHGLCVFVFVWKKDSHKIGFWQKQKWTIAHSANPLISPLLIPCNRRTKHQHQNRLRPHSPVRVLIKNHKKFKRPFTLAVKLQRNVFVQCTVLGLSAS